MDLIERLTAGGPKRLLALDAGGVRAALTLGILAHVERLLRERHSRPDLVLADYFDLIGGTSSGAVLAAALATGRSVGEITALFTSLAADIFGHHSFRPWTSLYSTEGIRRALESAFGSQTLGDPDLRTGLCIFAKRVDTGGTWRLINHPQGKFFAQNKDILIAQAVRASTAAPIYFTPEPIDVGGGETGVFVDGAVSMAANPALELFLVATLQGFPFHWQTGADRLLLVSAGTGVTRRPHALSGADSSTPWHWAATVPAMFMQDVSWHTQLLLQALSQTETHWAIDLEMGDLSDERLVPAPLLHYLRYNAWLEEDELQALGLEDLAPQLPRLRSLDQAQLVPELTQIGERAGERDVRPEHFPHRFDLPLSNTPKA